MVQVETSQLTAECNNWREALRNYRDEFTRDKAKLQQVTTKTLTKDQLQEVEHLQNQFHIQLINIHDLRHTIKAHARMIDFELENKQNQWNEETLAHHENFFDQYQSLDATLQDLRVEFERFLFNTR